MGLAFLLVLVFCCCACCWCIAVCVYFVLYRRPSQGAAGSAGGGTGPKSGMEMQRFVPITGVAQPMQPQPPASSQRADKTCAQHGEEAAQGAAPPANARRQPAAPPTAFELENGELIVEAV